MERYMNNKIVAILEKRVRENGGEIK